VRAVTLLGRFSSPTRSAFAAAAVCFIWRSDEDVYRNVLLVTPPPTDFLLLLNVDFIREIRGAGQDEQEVVRYIRRAGARV
jgi:hypothetical protein